MKPKIGVIAHYSGMKTAFKHLAEVKDCELLFKVGVLDLAIGIAIEMERVHQVQAIITNPKTAQIVQDYVTIPVVPLYVRDFNLISAFYKAHHRGKQIAFVAIRDTDAMYDFSYVRRILDYDVTHYEFDKISEVESVLDRIIQDKKDIIVTPASCMIAKAAAKHVDTILLEPEEHDLMDAIDNALSVINIKNEEIRKTRWIRAVVDTTSDGIITLNQLGNVSVVNQPAEKIIGETERLLIGHNIVRLKEKYPFFQYLENLDADMEIVKINDTEVVIHKQQVLSEGAAVIGTVYRLQELKSLQDMEMQTRRKKNQKGFVATNTFEDIKGSSEVMQRVKEKAMRYAKTKSNILIYGESGSGKEIFAQSIHNYSHCHTGPFLAINCATLPEPLLESELFGYEEGAFTGAKKGGKAGLLEIAHGGTLFLDEIGEMPIQLQSRLLRILQEKVVRRVGGNRNIPVDVRIISATNRDLVREVQEGRFREDLYYRINVLSLRLPPLRERREDIPEIAGMIARKIAKQNEKTVAIDFQAFDCLRKYEWTGNVRELYNFIERVIVLSSDGMVGASHLQQALSELRLMPATKQDVTSEEGNLISIPMCSLREMENIILKEVYRRCDGNKKEMERVLEMSNTTLWRRLRELEEK